MEDAFPGSSNDTPDTQADWEITPDGLYIATRHFLLRRGYCCANRCRNCPYINWHANPAWQPAPASAVRRVSVSRKVLAGVRASIAHHEQALTTSGEDEQAYHREMLAHYTLLLERWH
jgi:hypothetical protein